jgi:hypothetical protein
MYVYICMFANIYIYIANKYIYVYIQTCMCSLKICMFISFCPSLTPHNTAAQTGTDSKIHYGCASCTCPVLDTLSSNPFFPRSVCRVGAPGSAPAAPARTRWPLALSAFVRVGAVRVRCRRCSGFGRVARVRPQNQSLQRIFSNSFFFSTSLLTFFGQFWHQVFWCRFLLYTRLWSRWRSVLGRLGRP